MTVIEDLAAFARIELDAHDLEPWAEVIAELVRAGDLDDERGLWLTKAYNAFDDLSSAWTFCRRWSSPAAWERARIEHEAVRDLPLTQERRGMRGGRVAQHFDSYCAGLLGAPQREWVGQFVGAGATPEEDWRLTFDHLRSVWGAGRQTAYEWIEFLAKAHGLPVAAPDACLWESEGPRRSIEAICGLERPTRAELDGCAAELRDELADRGVLLAWEDFETVICDFHVMRHGRYYPGRHLAALREEIANAGSPVALLAAWDRVVPEGWRAIAPGIDKALLPVYRDTGRIVTPC